jgi:hypothetical protein
MEKGKGGRTRIRKREKRQYSRIRTKKERRPEQRDQQEISSCAVNKVDPTWAFSGFCHPELFPQAFSSISC